MPHPYLVPDDFRLYLAMFKGASVMQEDSGTPSAQAIGQLAASVWQKLGIEGAEAVPVVA
jgi:hypothetical protein